MPYLLRTKDDDSDDPSSCLIDSRRMCRTLRHDDLKYATCHRSADVDREKRDTEDEGEIDKGVGQGVDGVMVRYVGLGIDVSLGASLGSDAWGRNGSTTNGHGVGDNSPD